MEELELLKSCGLEVVPSLKIPEELGSVLKSFIKGQKIFLVLYGAPGTYKTTACKKLVYSILKKKGINPYNAYFIKFYNLVDWLLQDEELESLLKHTKLLVIDDLISLHLKESILLKLFAIVDERYEKQRKTIFTTNHNLQEFLNGPVSIFSRIASRLCDANISMLYETQGAFRNTNTGTGGEELW